MGAILCMEALWRHMRSAPELRVVATFLIAMQTRRSLVVEVYPMKLYASMDGFQYYIRSKPLWGAYVAMETFARGLLEYGHFDEYHAYYDRRVLRTFSADEAKRAYFRFEKLKVLSVNTLLKNPDVDYGVLHFEQFSPYEELFLRSILSRKNIPVTRRAYTVATQGHLCGFLDTCFPCGGGRPYDSIIVPSRATREAVVAYMDHVSSVTSGRLLYRGRVDVIPHGICLEQFQLRDRLRCREKFAIPAHAIVFLSMARITWASKMNYDRLLEFFSQLTHRTAAEVYLVIAGADRDNEARELIAIADKLGITDKMKIIANFKDEDKADILGCGDIFISLSDNLQESFGIALVEAMALGLPVICTDWDGYKDVVDEGITGYRIPTVWRVRECGEDMLINFRKDPWDLTVIHRLSRDIQMDTDLLLARALELIDHEGLRKRMGQNGRRKAETMYSIKTEIAQCEALWEELGQIAEKDRQEYADLHSLLNYDYPRHFRSYPTQFDPPLSDPVSEGAPPVRTEYRAPEQRKRRRDRTSDVV